MEQPGYFEITGTLDELLPKLRGTRLKQHGVVYLLILETAISR
jgi:hypothetical protein